MSEFIIFGEAVADNGTSGLHWKTHYIENMRELLLILAILLISSLISLIILLIALRNYKTATKNLIESRTRFHSRAVLIHENYLTLPSFVNDADEWRKRYEKARIDFEYTLSILAYDEDADENEKTISAKKLANSMLKKQAENKFADLKREHIFCKDEWSDWLTRFIQDNPKEEAEQMTHRLIALGKERGVGLDPRQKRRIRDEKRVRKEKLRKFNPRRSNKNSQTNKAENDKAVSPSSPSR